MILRSIRPDKMIFAVKAFVAKHMGEQFIHVPFFDLASSFADSSKIKPIILVLSQGCDPLSSVYNFTPEDPEDKPSSIIALSLGQGQGPAAEEAILEATNSGAWVILQNCHLAEKWMERLVKVWEDQLTDGQGEGIHRAFRLWLTSYATPNFPCQLLQSGVKVSDKFQLHFCCQKLATLYIIVQYEPAGPTAAVHYATELLLNGIVADSRASVVVSVWNWGLYLATKHICCARKYFARNADISI